jgi:hypothetical protein
VPVKATAVVSVAAAMAITPATVAIADIALVTVAVRHGISIAQ